MKLYPNIVKMTIQKNYYHYLLLAQRIKQDHLKESKQVVFNGPIF